MILRRIHITILCVLQAATIAFGQPFISTEVSSFTLAADGVLEVKYVIEGGRVENFEKPDFSGWRVLGGPYLSTREITKPGSGTAILTSYRYLLKPETEPAVQLIVPGAWIQVDQKRMQSNPATITIGASTAPPVNALAPIPPAATTSFARADAALNLYEGYLLREGEDPLKKIADHLFIRVETNKQSLYEGESLVAEYKLYVGVNLEGKVSRAPSFTGFSSTDLAAANHQTYSIVQLNGREFKVYLLKRVQLYALRAGNQQIEPMEIDTRVKFRKLPNYNNISRYDIYSPENNHEEAYTVKSEPVIIKVMPLPATQLKDFGGAVGRFSIQSQTSTRAISRGEAGKITLVLSGIGNWDMLPHVSPQWPEGTEVYQPKIREEIDSQAVPAKGIRTYEFTFTTQKAGKMVIPALQFSYFDPWKGAYQTVTAEAQSVEVKNEAYLPVAALAYISGEEDPNDFTQIFSRVGSIAFPALAFFLLFMLFASSRKRKNKKPVSEPANADTAFEEALIAASFNKQKTPVKGLQSPVQETILKPVVESPIDTQQPAITYRAKESAQTLRKEIIAWLQQNTGKTFSHPDELKNDQGITHLPAEWLNAARVVWQNCDLQIYGPIADLEAIEAARTAWNRLLYLHQRNPGAAS